jgi:predicted alpha/beta superfamily hydrolase
MSRMFTATLGLVALVGVGLSGQPASPVKCSPTVSGDLRIESLESGTYGEKRKIRVWLPAGYDAAANTQTYPVLYMFDGQTLFDACTAFSGEGEWGIDETLTRLIAEKKIPPMIVVGMDSNSRRGYEYQPWRDVIAEPAALEPIGKLLPAFVVNDVMVYIAGHYRVTTDPARTGIGGASLSGIAALYVLLNRPDRFGMGLIESPTLPLGNGQMLRDTALLARGPDRVSIGVGTTELAFPGGEGVKFAAQTRMPLASANAGFARMAETLAANFRAAYLNHPDVTLVVEPNANHTVASWARRFSSAVTVLYGEPAGKTSQAGSAVR